MLVRAVSIDLDKLLEDRCSTSSAFDGESSRVVEVTVDRSIVFIIRVLRSKDCRTDRAGEMLDVELHIYVDQIRGSAKLD